MRRIILPAVLLAASLTAGARGVTINVTNSPAEPVFKEMIAQTGMNFVYSAGTLDGLKITVDAYDEALPTLLQRIFNGTPIRYKIKGRNVILTRKEETQRIAISGYVREAETGEALVGALVVDSLSRRAATTNAAGFYSLFVDNAGAKLVASFPGFVSESATVHKNILDFNLTEKPLGSDATELSELLVVGDRNIAIAHDATDVGHIALTNKDIKTTPVIFGETDVIKTLQHLPGVSAGTEGMAGMYVHGGNHDENLYMLDNIPLYQVNHFGGLFSAFNTEAVKNVDFYKSSFPAKYNGRLSSIVEVHTKDGSRTGHHGSFKLGLTSGAFNIDGPLFSSNTTYSLAVRRSWFEVLSIPALAIFNKVREDKENKTIAQYDFMDVNAKVTHRFSERSEVHAMFYYGDDYLKAGSKSEYADREKPEDVQKESDIIDMRWGNLVGALGWNYKFSPTVFGEFTAAYTHYRAKMHRDTRNEFIQNTKEISSNRRDYITRNSIQDLTLRADLGWNPGYGHRVIFGANATYHTFRPDNESIHLYDSDTELSTVTDVSPRLHAMEIAYYIGDDWEMGDRFRLSYGLNGGMFHVCGKSHLTVDPRVGLRVKLSDRLSLKGAYSRMSQYVHQLTESTISLPSDKWVPIAGDFSPQRSDKVSVAGYYSFANHGWELSVEGYMKWMHNIIDYTDDYSTSIGSDWLSKLTSGSGRAKGADFMLARLKGKITGHIAYSLLWADRQFPDVNDGRRFPARFDNRHKINILANWRINDRWEVSGAWTGMSGNRITLYDQNYLPLPNYYGPSLYDDLTLAESINNYRLPFYNRLDLSLTRYTKHGNWNISLYNAYCYMNPATVIRDYDLDMSDNVTWWSRPAFKLYRLLPLIPSFSYTWIF